jgi:hypothetical protein
MMFTNSATFSDSLISPKIRLNRPSKGGRAIQDAITEAIDGRGKVITPRAGMPPVRAARVIDIREEFDRSYVVPESDPDKAYHAKRVAFKRALDRLSPSQYGAGHSEGADWVWRITSTQ